ncbi:hypothetical protein PFLUV_G00003840 [Perca fluviatilis]|uniref:Ig-like domain-containing protein n=1 Tax=Perca fluviatilis TaxID=8168 RepID=A0A6A5EXS0_PERFL|nr:hypothetical protein PFLUV_G00003840 [Perca fluviatilis]
MKWYTVHRNGSKTVQKELSTDENRVTYNMSAESNFTLTIKDLSESDANDYCCRETTDDPELCWNNKTELHVSGLKVKFTPSAVVTEGQRVTLSCSTSCPLTDNTTYIWYLNSRPLTPTEKQNKNLVLDPVSRQHTGRYSCAVKTPHKISSNEKTLTVQSKMGKWNPAAAAAVVCAALLIIIPFTIFWWIRRKRTSRQNPRTETSDNLEQINSGPVYDNISAPPPEQAGLHYSRVHFSKSQTDPLYSTLQHHQPREQEHVHYAVVNFRRNRTPE